jgi:hypothetical protein
MNDELFVQRVLEKLDKMDERINDLCSRITELETIHRVTETKFNQLMAVIGAASAIIGIIAFFN